MERVARLLEYLRSRPEQERRIIGGAVWVAMAAIFIAVWIASFRQTLTIESPTNQASLQQKEAMTEPENAEATLAPDLPSPLKSLIGGFEDFRARLEEVSRRIQNQLGKFQLPQLNNQNRSFGTSRPSPDKASEDSGFTPLQTEHPAMRNGREGSIQETHLKPQSSARVVTGSKIEFIARIQKWIKGASNVSNSLIEALTGLGRK